MPFYITTTLPYANAQPHLGHALEFIQADVIARYQKQQGQEVIFNVGTDEHGLKMREKAQENKQDIHAFVAENRQHFIKFCQLFNISYDHFYATSDPQHIDVAQAFRQACQARGDIYKKNYTGKYCVGCESFKTPKDLTEDGLCPDHGKAPIDYQEENYFFRLSNYRDLLIGYIDQGSKTDAIFTSISNGGIRQEKGLAGSFVLPAHKNNELRNFVAKMNDISISRSKQNLPRGVPVPGDDSQVMYVRFDALSNYAGAVGYPDDMEKFNHYRGTADQPNAVQICGPDNLRFQGAIRQGMLASAGLPRTQKLLVHGMILGPDGNKMSKTLGNVISPFKQLEKYGLTAFRYYLIAGIPTFGDAAYQEEELINLHNSHLANSFGNLLNRVIHLANKKNIAINDNSQAPSSPIQEKIASSLDLIASSFSSYNLHSAAAHIHDLTLYANEYISRPGQEPRNKEVSPEDAEQVLIDCAAMLSVIIDGYSHILPEKCEQARHMLDHQEKGILFQKI